MNPFKKIALVIALLAVPGFAFGQSISNAFSGTGPMTIGGVTVTPSFTPSVTDLSMSYLGQIFGTVGTVLHGTSGQMLGQIFKVFNIGILVLAGIFLIYTIVMTVLNTAHEGEFMGRKWNSAWIAIRTVLGLGLLVPSPVTGYSTIQIIVMWVVIQGVGFANMAWDSALNYIANGGQLYTPPATDTASMVDLVGTVLEMQICMYTAQNVETKLTQNQKQLQEQQQQSSSGTATNTAAPSTPTQNYVQNFTPLFTDIQDTKSNVWKSVVKFPGNKYLADGQQDNACGQISFGSNAAKDALDSDSKASTLQAAIRQVAMDTDSYAKQIVSPTTQGNNENFSNQVQGAIVGGAADWVNITLPIRLGAPTTSNDLIQQYYKSSVQQGWIMAGRYYYALGSIQRQVTAATTVNVSIDNPPAGFANTNAYIDFSNPPTPSIQNINNQKPPLSDFGDQDKKNLIGFETTTASYVTASRNVANSVDQSNQISLSYGDAGILGFLLNPIVGSLYQAIQSFSTTTGDPILVLQTIGNDFLITALSLWLAGTVGVFALGTASSVLSSVQPVGYGVEDAVFTFVPTFTLFIMTFFVLGLTLAYYVPLIPFIIYVFSAIGWLIAVIEAMVAAPLVALGITHPEGHDILGKSEQAIMLLLSVFLRPVLMVIGLIAGMILSRVVLRFLNTGFFGIVYDVGDFSLLAFIGVLMIYAMLLVSIVNQAFSLIYAIPDRVMRWLGVSEQTGAGAQEALQAAKGGFEQVAGAQGKLAEGTQGGAIKGAGGALKAERERRSLQEGELEAKPKPGPGP